MPIAYNRVVLCGYHKKVSLIFLDFDWFIELAMWIMLPQLFFLGSIKIKAEKSGEILVVYREFPFIISLLNERVRKLSLCIPIRRIRHAWTGESS